MARLRLGLHQVPGLELLVGLEHGGDAHPFLLTELTHRREPIAGAEDAGVDGIAHARGHLLEEERFVSAGDGHEELLGWRMRAGNYPDPFQATSTVTATDR